MYTIVQQRLIDCCS